MCDRMGGGATVWTHNPYVNPKYSTDPISPAPIIQSPEENLILCNPPHLSPPPQDESNKEDEEGGGFSSREGGGFKKK